MKSFKTAGGTEFTSPEQGTHPGTLVGVVDLGLQPATDFDTKQPIADKSRTLMLFEIAGVDQEDGRPTVMVFETNTSTHERSTLHKVVKAILGGTAEAEAKMRSGLIIQDLLGKTCSVQIGPTKTGKTKITGISPAMRGLTVTPARSELLLFDIDDPDMEVFGKLYKWVQNRISQASNAPTGLVADEPTDHVVHVANKDPVNF